MEYSTYAGGDRLKLKTAELPEKPVQPLGRGVDRDFRNAKSLGKNLSPSSGSLRMISSKGKGIFLEVNEQSLFVARTSGFNPPLTIESVREFSLEDRGGPGG